MSSRPWSAGRQWTFWGGIGAVLGTTLYMGGVDGGTTTIIALLCATTVMTLFVLALLDPWPRPADAPADADAEIEITPFDHADDDPDQDHPWWAVPLIFLMKVVFVVLWIGSFLEEKVAPILGRIVIGALGTFLLAMLVGIASGAIRLD